jgi:hypothetical protein
MAPGTDDLEEPINYPNSVCRCLHCIRFEFAAYFSKLDIDVSLALKKGMSSHLMVTLRALH